jgi:hypothetical protein
VLHRLLRDHLQVDVPGYPGAPQLDDPAGRVDSVARGVGVLARGEDDPQARICVIPRAEMTTLGLGFGMAGSLAWDSLTGFDTG